MKIVLVRHGQTRSNVSGALDAARPGLPLDEVGREQAQRLADRWENEVAAPPTVVAVSPITRTRQTAQPLCQMYGRDLLVRPGIREIRSGDLEMSPSVISINQYIGTCGQWMSGNLDALMPGGENGHEVLSRVCAVVAEVAQKVRDSEQGENGVGVLVAHGALIRVVAPMLSPQIAAHVGPQHFMSNTGTTVLEWPEGLVVASPVDLLGALRGLTWNDTPVDAVDPRGGHPLTRR